MNALQAQVHSPDLERAVLGVILDGRHPQSWSTFLDHCAGPTAFFIRDHRVIALACSLLAEAGTKIDTLSVIARLAQMPWMRTWQTLRSLESGSPVKVSDDADGSSSALDEIGGHERVHEIQGALAPAAGFPLNCQMLAGYAAQRAVVVALLEATERANAVDGAKELPAIVDRAINRLASLVMTQEGTATVSEAMRRAITRHRAGVVLADRPLPSWGLPALDKALPLRPCRYVLLAAQPGHGKSSLAFQAAVASAERLGDGAVALINYEMPAEQIGAILLGRAIAAPVKAIENGTMNPDQTAAAEQHIAVRAEADVFLRTGRKSTIDEVLAWIRQRHVRSAGRLALVVIDYVQLIGRKRHQNEYEMLSEASPALKGIANELRICLLVLSQMNRDGTKADRDSRGNVKGNPEPRMQDLRGSGSLEQDADAIVFIWPPQEGESDDLDVNLKIAKNRSGPTTRRDHHIQAVFERANGQSFRQVSAPSNLTREDSSRSHHNHPPTPDEDGWGDRPQTEPA